MASHCVGKAGGTESSPPQGDYARRSPTAAEFQTVRRLSVTPRTVAKAATAAVISGSGIGTRSDGCIQPLYGAANAISAAFAITMSPSAKRSKFPCAERSATRAAMAIEAGTARNAETGSTKNPAEAQNTKPQAGSCQTRPPAGQESVILRRHDARWCATSAIRRPRAAGYSRRSTRDCRRRSRRSGRPRLRGATSSTSR